MTFYQGHQKPRARNTAFAAPHVPMVRRQKPGLTGPCRAFLSLVAVSLSSVSTATAMLNKDGLPLPMSFEASSEVMLLFSWWNARTAVQYAVCCICCIVFGFISIALKVLRHIVEMRLVQAADQGRPMLKLGSFPVIHNALRGSIAFLNYSWDYMLMLVAMTFNMGIFISMLTGIALGFLMIGRYLDYAPDSHVAAGCECDRDGSCGCHRGQPCTCYKTASIVRTNGDIKACSSEPLTAHPGACLATSTCGKAKCVV